MNMFRYYVDYVQLLEQDAERQRVGHWKRLTRFLSRVRRNR